MGIGAATATGATALGASAAAASAAGTAATAIGAIGAAASAYGSIKSGMYSAQVAKNNSKIATQSANYSIEAGNTAAENESMKNASQAGILKASQAANNVDVNSGSAVDVQADQDAAGQLDTQTVMHNALLQAYGYQTQATSQSAQATQDSQAGVIQAAGGLLSNASSLGFKWSGLGGPNADSSDNLTNFPSAAAAQQNTGDNGGTVSTEMAGAW